MAAPQDTIVLDSRITSYPLIPMSILIPTNTTVRVNFFIPSYYEIPVGERVIIAGFGAGGWNIQQNAGQTITFGDQLTTTGVTGGLASTLPTDGVAIVCVVANTTFVVISSNGNITIT